MGEDKQVTHIPYDYHSPALCTTMASPCICPALLIVIFPGPRLILGTEEHVANQIDVLCEVAPQAHQRFRSPIFSFPTGKNMEEAELQEETRNTVTDMCELDIPRAVLLWKSHGQ